MIPDFCSIVSAVLSRTGMDPRSLVLDLTESSAIERSAQIMQVLAGLTALGVRLALDDFGTGYFYTHPMTSEGIAALLTAPLEQGSVTSTSAGQV
jgi:EAL domain-containing protein (putative c-di-GMP-specific phosphodiesterase class I)